ncbi:MAG: hypothetical protein WD025_01915 [Bacteriovoracaceae bacterium]
MKKLLLIAIAATLTGSVFAQNEKHMIQFYGWDSGSRGQSVDLSRTSNDADQETNLTNVSLNYAYALTPAFQLGATWRSLQGEFVGADVDASTIGLNFFWNLEEKLTDTHVLGLRYWVTNYNEALSAGASEDYVAASEDDTITDLAFEYGYRWKIGSGWDSTVTFAPSVAYEISTFQPDSGNDVVTSNLSWNFLKFDLLF